MCIEGLGSWASGPVLTPSDGAVVRTVGPAVRRAASVGGLMRRQEGSEPGHVRVSIDEEGLGEQGQRHNHQRSECAHV